MARTLMLVSQAASRQLRWEVEEGRRPCPEYLRLEAQHDVELLDWSRLPLRVSRRTVPGSLAHVATALRRLDRFDVVFSDGEHLGIPLGLAIRLRNLQIPHLMLGHHLTTARKRRVFRALRSERGISRILMHSRRQIEVAQRDLGVAATQLAFVPYFADSEFWSPRKAAEENLLVTAGREHRDYATFAAACFDLPVRVVVAAGSFHSPRATWKPPASWPANFELLHMLDRIALRDLYASAKVIVVPVLNTDFQAGVTTLLEAMAMGKAVVVSGTDGQRDIVEDGETGIVVPPGHVRSMREAIRRLIDDPRERARLGANARAAAQTRFSLDAYATAIAGHLDELAQDSIGSRPAAIPNGRTTPVSV
jgi:glycosyltransferase involved in cell wall biosynthesis